jgi:hypothetical protein
MAKVETVKRAVEVFEIYKALAPDLNPVQLHTGVAAKERSENKRKVTNKFTSKASLCYDEA